ncbi:MAG: gamma-glutamyl-gamma-aminobutyrate hydrolase family protein [bacterium]|nr:gamma-glutamyl-gamma-aminobutyrate hydrolase family protein [bacterium]
MVADPATISSDDVKQVAPIGIILSGGPSSVVDEPPPLDKTILGLGIPTLGICLGLQGIAQYVGAEVTSASQSPSGYREFGTHIATITEDSSSVNALFRGLPRMMDVLESHGDCVQPSPKLTILATTENAPVAAARGAAKEHQHLYGVQFHPEVEETQFGSRILANFCFGVCGAKESFRAQDEAEIKTEWLRQEIGDKLVVIGLSAGSDSSTCAHLVKKALNDQPGRVLGVYIKATDRPEDEEFVRRHFGNQDWIELKVVDATSQFLKALRNQPWWWPSKWCPLQRRITMKQKRRAMKRVYHQVLEDEITIFAAAKNRPRDEVVIIQGTLYTDLCESGHGYNTGARRATIKEHHNVGIPFSVKELCPLDDCVKDNGRNIGRAIGVPEELLTRHPFPGPGLIVRIEGEVTADKLRIARAADKIWIDELRDKGFYHKVWQAGVFVTQSGTTCTKGDDATSGLVIIFWAVNSTNGFTARAADLPMSFLRRVSQRMTNEIREVGAAAYRTSDKPPTTIEFG